MLRIAATLQALRETGRLVLRGLLPALIGLVIVPQCAAVESPAKLARQARALLSDRCFTCHGPDSAAREADLRLDDREALFAESTTDDTRQIVTPSNIEASELWHRVSSGDADLRMPPSDSNLSLSPDEIALLKRWIEAGAPWTEHWAFVPPATIDPPPAELDSFSRSEIDRFVAARLKRNGLSLSPEADKAQLLRRVTLDLTGLPPTIEETDAFLSDESPEGYEKVVDRLLASPRFGERMATPWLDAARYADTYGYQADRYRAVWQWRDWVVRSLNDNLPYDDFITWQLAGDLLPDATRDQKLATTFNRLHRQTNEGGSVPAEWRAEYVADRTNTLGAAVLGLTLECARCHDHKFDPISQRDYYQLSAYFNNIDELGVYSHFTDSVPTPTLWLDTPAQRKELDRIEVELRQAEADYAQIAESQRTDFEKWLKRDEQTKVATPEAVFRFGFEEAESTGLSGKVSRTPGVVGDALELDGENGLVAKGVGRFARDDAFTIALWVQPTEKAKRAVVLHRSRAWLDAAGRGYQIILEKGRPSVALVHSWPGNALGRRAIESIPVGEWTHLAMTYDGSSRASGLRLFVDGREIETEVTADSLDRTIKYVAGDIEGDGNVHLTVGHRFRDNGFRGGLVDELMVFDQELMQPEIAVLPGFDRLDETPLASREQSFRYYLARHQEEATQAAQRVSELRRQRSKAIDAIPEIMAMREMTERRTTYLLERGAYDAPGDAVLPRTPESIASNISRERDDRLGLAEWVTDANNPLTARVAVNRLWHSLFGRGLVATLNDFGSQGASPSHPDLLDWLARTYVESGWDTKAMVKRMVLSSTYRQSSVATQKLREADPENILLARGPSYRLSAEVLRDSALAASRLLVEQIGGPPVRPFQPPGLWKEKGAASYSRNVGAGSHRRSLYTYWKRTSPPPSMMIFDAADREVCIMQRQVTATPLQALVMLNDPQTIEAARGLADHAWQQEEMTTNQRVTFIFRSLAGRAPTEREETILMRLYIDQRTHYATTADDARALLAIGDHKTVSDASPENLAAMTMVALAVMNHDAFVMKR